MVWDMHVETVPELCNPTLWRYKGEGNANVILALRSPHERFGGVVLRLRKGGVLMHDEQQTPEMPSFLISYTRDVLVPLFGNQYTGETKLLQVTPEFLQSLAEAIEPSRPAKRRHIGIDVHQEFALLMPDYTVFTSSAGVTLAVELKPKWGFIPTSSFIKPENSVKRLTCRTCMHQHLRHMQGDQTVEIIDYCPLDLFSCDESRLRKSLPQLIKLAGNKFKLFIQGEKIDIGQDGWHTKLNEFFQITNDFVNDSHQSNTPYQLFVDLLVKAIVNEQGLFQRLRSLQKSLDSLDIEGIYLLDLIQQGQLLEPNLEEWKKTVEVYLKRMEETAAGPLVLKDMTLDEQRQSLYEYLLSATLKDCSIMFSFQKPDDNCDRTLSGSLFNHSDDVKRLEIGNILDYVEYRVKLLDLDPKSVTKLPYYYDLDTEIVKCYQKRELHRECYE
ncbi:314_t:CDS:2 [Paraglomus brasilianum]|uniref:Inositol-pentakisphosphate 2-kinase n=1 Tax=Paraglomus brasilianum TaxID=144538 RepID=A0A9N9B1Q3_9GLOM|nr:314_t:CDS:2 [Paraglomus brasilianum]